jgi:hypothetical protein
MKKEIKKEIKKYEKLVDDICSDETGADKPYSEHLRKWALEIMSIVNDAEKRLIKKLRKDLKIN